MSLLLRCVKNACIGRRQQVICEHIPSTFWRALPGYYTRALQETCAREAVSREKQIKGWARNKCVPLIESINEK